MTRHLLLAALLAAVCSTAAFAQCKPPKPVKNYLRSHPSWSVVDVSDLGPADRATWKRAHRGLCPGLASVELAARGGKSLALAVTNQAHGSRMERLILLQADGKKLTPKTLVPAFPVGDPLVVWRGKPRTVREFGSRRKIAIAHDSIVFEKLGLSSKVFYLEDGRMRTVLVAE